MKKFIAIIFTIALAYLVSYYTADEKIRKEKSDFLQKLKYLVTDELDTTDAYAVSNRAFEYQYDLDLYEDAIELYQRAQELDPDYYTLNYNMAECYLELSDTAKAVEALNILLEKEPKNIDGLMLIGKISFEKGDLSLAEEFFKRVLKENKSVSALNYLAKIYIQKKDYEKALEYTRKAKDLEPENLDVLETQRQILLKLNRNKEAAIIYKMIRIRDPYFYPDYEQLAKSAKKTGENQTAVNYYTLYLNENPTDESAIDSRGWLYIYLEKYDSAYYDFNKLIQLDTTNYSYYFNKAYVLDFMDSIQEAIQVYHLCMMYNDTNQYVFNNLGYEYFRLEDYDNAEKYYTKSIELAPDYYLPLYNRGILYFNTKKYEKALDDFKNALSLSPENSGIIYYIANCYDKMEEKNRALDYYNEYIRLAGDDIDSTDYNFVIERIAELSK